MTLTPLAISLVVYFPDKMNTRISVFRDGEIYPLVGVRQASRIHARRRKKTPACALRHWARRRWDRQRGSSSPGWARFSPCSPGKTPSSTPVAIKPALSPLKICTAWPPLIMLHGIYTSIANDPKFAAGRFRSCRLSRRALWVFALGNTAPSSSLASCRA